MRVVTNSIGFREGRFSETIRPVMLCGPVAPRPLSRAWAMIVSYRAQAVRREIPPAADDAIAA